MGELDNTLVIYIFGDNGASMEGTITGSFNELTMQNGIALTPEQQLSLIDAYGGLDAWGTDAFAPHYASAWAWAGNAPFQWGKQVASHLGGTRNGMVVSWPERITDAGGCGRSSPTASTSGRRSSKRPGIPRAARWWTGSNRSRWTAPASCTASTTPSAAERHTVQYFEIYGNRAIYKDGWWAALHARPHPLGRHRRRRSRRFAPGTYDPDRTRGSSTTCPTTSPRPTTSPPSNPEKLAELKELFWEEAEKYNVLPLLAGLLGVLRDPAADADDHHAHLLRRRGEHRLRA